MSWLSRRCCTLIVILLAGSSCGGTGETAVDMLEAEEPPEESTSTDLPTSTAPAIPSSAVPGAAAGLGEPYVPPDAWQVFRQRPIDGAMLHPDGVSIEISFVGGPQVGPSDPCARNYEIVFGGTETEVRLALLELTPSDPDEVPDDYGCDSVGHGWRLGVTLDQPLGARRLIDDLTSAPVPLADLANVLQPGYVPAGWVAQPPQIHGGQLERWYSHPEREPAFLYVLSTPLSETSNLESLRARDLVRIEDITVRANPAISVTSLEDGAVTIAWEEQELLYQVHGYLVDAAELTAMAESMGG